MTRLLAHTLPTPPSLDRSLAAQAEIEKEVEVMKRLSHPNIVRYIGTERDERELTIFLELVPGGSISSMLGKYGKFKESGESASLSARENMRSRWHTHSLFVFPRLCPRKTTRL